MQRKLNNPNGHKFLPFRAQMATVVIIVELLLITFSVGVIWNHIDSLELVGNYSLMAKTGLIMVEFVAIVTALWKLFARTRMIAFWAFWVNVLIVVMMLVHAGAVLKYESSGIQHKQSVEMAADAQAKIAAATEAARIEAASREASRLNSIGQRSTARRIAESARVRSDDKAAQTIAQFATNGRRETFLPEWYMAGGMYVLPPLVAFLLLMFLVFISSGVIHVEDANQDGIPDFLQREPSAPTELAERHHAPRLEPQFGAHTAARPIQDRLKQIAKRSPKS